MITRKILTLFSILFLSTVVFAQNKTVVFFAESIEGLPAKVVQKIEGTDNFCFAASFTEEKNIKKGIKKLIFCRKIEPMLDIAEPYFSLIGSEKQLGDELVFNRTSDCENIIKSYKTKYRKAFKIYKHGLYLRGAALDDMVLDMFYKYNILWTMAKSENDNQKGLFLKNGVALFVPYKNFTTDAAKIEQWFNSCKANVIPVILTSVHTKNESFMTALINFVEKKSDIDVKLPLDAAFYEYNYKTIKNNLSLEISSALPKEKFLKLCLANKEVNNYANKKESKEVYSILFEELSNMYSYSVINGILKGNYESEKLFDIYFMNIFRVLNKKEPNIKEYQKNLSDNNFTDSQTSTNIKFKKENNSISINNEGEFFDWFSVSDTGENVVFETDANLDDIDSLDIYIDMNGMAYTGSQKMLNPVNSFFVPENSWEFAIRITKGKIYIYKYLNANIDLVDEFENDEGYAVAKVSGNVLTGNPYNWNYQAVAIKDEKVVDFIENKREKGKKFKVSPLQINMYKYK
jgi:hypothetical protein